MFIQKDRRLLESMGVPVRPARRLREMLRAIPSATHVVIWFAAEHAFYAVKFARLFRKPTLLILGGYEGAADREIGYGLWLRPWHVQLRAAAAIRESSEVWAVEPSLADRTLELGGIGPREVRVVHTLFDPEEFRPAAKDVGAVFVASSAHRLRKGLPLVREAARRVRITILDWMDRASYVDLLSRARVIVNASRHEGLNNSLCEAMLCEAVPVISHIPGNLHAVGPLVDRGLAFTYEVGDADSLVEGIECGLEAAGNRDTAPIRQHVLDRFPQEGRRAAFEEFLEVGT